LSEADKEAQINRIATCRETCGPDDENCDEGECHGPAAIPTGSDCGPDLRPLTPVTGMLVDTCSVEDPDCSAHPINGQATVCGVNTFCFHVAKDTGGEWAVTACTDDTQCDDADDPDDDDNYCDANWKRCVNPLRKTTTTSTTPTARSWC
jgi:hypothetical protein